MEWWRQIPVLWKAVIGVMGGIALIIGTYRGVDGYVAKRCDLDAHKIVHNKDVAELSIQTQKSGLRQDLRWNSKEQFEMQEVLRKDPENVVARERLQQLKREQKQMEIELIGLQPVKTDQK